MAGYSGTPLATKLGIKDGTRVRVSGAPGHYLALLRPIPENATISNRIRHQIDIWHFFTKSIDELESELPKLIYAIRPDGAIWVSWPKKSSGVLSSVTEDAIRKVALPLGLVDIKVCAVDTVWSGLKLVIRKELRTEV
jgi:hypothetical protein